MNLQYFKQQSIFVLKTRYLQKICSFFRGIKYRAQGMSIGQGTTFPKLFVTWPHQVKFGDNCRLEHGIYFHYDGIYSKGPSICIGENVFIGNNSEFNISEKITVGNNCLIAAGCRFIDHNHGIEKGTLIRAQLAPKQEIILENDVWLGCNVVILKGVCIGEGAVVAAGSVVSKNIPSYEIWGGVPAKFIKKRV
jgi:acetyltransferase-like isoleucine patch superfamily enzyme